MDPFTALADPTRRQILELLGDGERAAGAIADQFASSPPAISQHLKVLRETGLVRVRPEGQHRFYRLDPTGLSDVASWIERVGRFWSERLDALELALDPQAGNNKETRK